MFADFLSEMATSSRTRVRDAIAAKPLRQLRQRCADLPSPPRLRLDDRFDVIAEIKPRSPSAGSLGSRIDAAVLATTYAEAGAAAISVLTEPSRFGGSLADLKTASAASRFTPTMRKDFLTDPYQLHEARLCGAGGALLIARMLSGGALLEMLDAAAALSLFVLLETFDEDDMARAIAHAGDGVLIGVNARDLATLDIVRERHRALARFLPPHAASVAESGLKNAKDVEAVAKAGYRAALVGGALMRSHDAGALLTGMIASGRAA